MHVQNYIKIAITFLELTITSLAVQSNVPNCEKYKEVSSFSETLLSTLQYLRKNLTMMARKPCP